MTRSPIALAALATLAVPGLDVVATRPPVRTTTDYQTVGVLDSRGRHWIVRMPRTAAAGASLEGEVALLERLAVEADAGRLPFDVERPAGFTTLSEGGRAMVTRDLPGRTVDPVDIDDRPGLADHLGVALAALHGLPTDLVGDTGLPVYDMATYRSRRLHEVDEAARTGDVPPELIHRWEAALESDDLWRVATTVVHGDLDAELVRVAGDRVVALTLFGDAHVGDPAEDVAWLVSAVEPETFDQVHASYEASTGTGADPFLLDRAQLASELLLVRWLMFGRRTEDAAVITDARHMLVELSRDLADAPPIGAETRAMLTEPAPTVVGTPDAGGRAPTEHDRG
ncbi:MAG: phosphotransferase, partial [Actinomycetaceae bacterium]